MRSQKENELHQQESKAGYYDSYFARFNSNLYHEIRCETYGDDLGQNGWLTCPELAQFMDWLQLKAGDHLLDVGCGTGGPTLHVANVSGCRATGIDVNAEGITRANALAASLGLADRVKFQEHDASQPLPFPATAFEAVICLDAIGHLPDRSAVLTEWARVLKPGGRLVFTDAMRATGSLSEEEMAVLSVLHPTLVFTAPGENERLVGRAGFQIRAAQDTTDSWASVVRRWQEARQKREAALREIEGDTMVDGQAMFLRVVEKITRERRLTRFAYFAAKPA
jgi:ubiquinone/menaquinone biosynthesis C-methylase UbiE